MKSLMTKLHKKTGDRFMGMDLLYLTTVGAKSGQERVSPVARFAEGAATWLVVGSNGGSDKNPSWYYNLKAHPDQVSVEVEGAAVPVGVKQLEGEDRAAAWEKIKAAQPRFAGYEKKTDRELPIFRLTAL
jgi:deazaflavin-dependent oxidoreductase (nitroreductase family)